MKMELDAKTCIHTSHHSLSLVVTVEINATAAYPKRIVYNIILIFKTHTLKLIFMVNP